MLDNLFSLTNRVALVTGAARGLGAAMASALGNAGAHVIINDIDDDALERQQAHLSEHGLSVQALSFDVTDPDAVSRAFAVTKDTQGRLDILINNAGIAIFKGIEEHTREDWDQVIDVNLTALYQVAREAAALMSENRYGRIINIASILGMASRPGIGSYVVAKHGVIGLTRALAGELGERRITCNAIAPGYFQSPMNEGLEDDAVFHRMIVDRTPLKRWAEPSELAGPVVFLASDASSFITGHTLVVDGGMTSVLF
jgi:gluconate 5-dehydrogenase